MILFVVDRSKLVPYASSPGQYQAVTEWFPSSVVTSMDTRKLWR